jgi:hypothetical protein
MASEKTAGKRRKSFWCWLGLHEWDVALMECAECGKPDDFLRGIVRDALEKLRQEEPTK